MKNKLKKRFEPKILLFLCHYYFSYIQSYNLANTLNQSFDVEWYADESYSRNALCALHLISTSLLLRIDSKNRIFSVVLKEKF